MSTEALIGLAIIGLIVIALIAYIVYEYNTWLLDEHGNIAFGEECKQVGSNHGDTTESEDKFYKQIHNQEFCEFVEDIDREELEGQIREDTKHDWEWFVDTKVFQTAFEDAKFCMLERYELRDDGKEHLADYEMQECGQGKYD